MRDVFVVGDNILSPLGATTSENVEAIKALRTGVNRHTGFMGSTAEVQASLFKNSEGPGNQDLSTFTRFEKILVMSIETALEKTSVDLKDPRTILVLTSTKGNISLLEEGLPAENRSHAISLPASADKIARWFGHPHTPVLVSNACISGLAAMIVAKRLIQSGKADHAVVAGADVITRFVQSGFASFQVLSPEICMPFD